MHLEQAVQFLEQTQHKYPYESLVSPPFDLADLTEAFAAKQGIVVASRSLQHNQFLNWYHAIRNTHMSENLSEQLKQLENARNAGIIDESTYQTAVSAIQERAGNRTVTAGSIGGNVSIGDKNRQITAE